MSLNHHREHAEVGFLAHDPDDVVWGELTLGLDGVEMTFLVLHAKHHAMVTQAEVDILQSVTDEGTALAEFDGDDGQVVRLLVSLGQRQHFLFASGTQGLDGFAASHHLQLVARIDAMAAAGDVYSVSRPQDCRDMHAVVLAEMELRKRLSAPTGMGRHLHPRYLQVLSPEFSAVAQSGLLLPELQVLLERALHLDARVLDKSAQHYKYEDCQTDKNIPKPPERRNVLNYIIY